MNIDEKKITGSGEAAPRDQAVDDAEHGPITDPSDGIGSNVSGDELKSEKEIESEDNDNLDTLARLIPENEEAAEFGKKYEFTQSEVV
jgi:hypothetical protein